MSDETVQLTITSPPYNLGKDYDEAGDDRRPIAEWRELMDDVIRELFRATAPDGKVCINIAASFDSEGDGRYRRVPLRSHVMELCRDAGFDFLDEFAWIKDQYTSHGDGALLGSYPYPTNVPVNQRHEYILVFRKYVSEEYHERRDLPPVDSERRRASKLTNDEWREYAQSVWELPRPSPDVETDHPAVFPLELPRRLIALYSFAGDLVLDPFVGTGTTAVAAKQTGRDYVGFDQNQSYIATARQRLDTSTDDGEEQESTPPSPPEGVAQYIRDAVDRQDPTTLRLIGDYAHELATHREFVPEEEVSQVVDDEDQIAGVRRTHNGTIVAKEVSCGKENCSSCPHGPYKYRVYRDGGNVKTEYLGPAESVSKS
ncbi:site-specific DNA-methyltransferase [Halorubellus sp. PRR65]|uniref:DNA-methyltransferase n=1 Tax=Halorubellus sp. PRR65 TaxID=3098148 RepID=UPI002B25896F|nr:site-specific DNA-methyltransferase [Halorubellus sp. PRR65]